MYFKKILGVIFLASLLACNNENKSTNDKDSVAVSKEKATTKEVDFKDEKLQDLYVAYITLKNDLVNAKYDEAKTAATHLSVKLKDVAGCENTAVITNKIAMATNIATQRKEFTALSNDVIALFKHAELTAGNIYVQHCPMANNGDGGDWLSSEKKIQNPYYGSEMMECGSVVQEIKPVK
jgi:hypothetical protein